MTAQKILISRTDKIGDVVLTLPLAGLLKSRMPGCKVAFLGQKYTRAIVESSRFVDEFHDWGSWQTLPSSERIALGKSLGFDAILHVFPRPEIANWARLVGIPTRVGTTHRLYHLWTCNRWLNLARRHSPLHEAQLNLELARPLVPQCHTALEDIFPFFGLESREPLPAEIENLLSPEKINLVLHPKSKGSAREWPLDNFKELAATLPPENFRIFITGGPDETPLLEPCFPASDGTVTNLAGRLSLSQLLTFLARADGLVAASTGPLHIAAALGRQALGLYPPIEPMHPARWGPLGPRARAVSVSKRCETCRHGGDCACMRAIPVKQVREIVCGWRKL